MVELVWIDQIGKTQHKTIADDGAEVRFSFDGKAWRVRLQDGELRIFTEMGLSLRPWSTDTVFVSTKPTL